MKLRIESKGDDKDRRQTIKDLSTRRQIQTHVSFTKGPAPAASCYLLTAAYIERVLPQHDFYTQQSSYLSCIIYNKL